MLHVAVMEEMSSTLAALLSKSGYDDDSDDNQDNHDNHDNHGYHDNHGSDDSHENHDQASFIREPQEKEIKSDLRKNISTCKRK